MTASDILVLACTSTPWSTALLRTPSPNSPKTSSQTYCPHVPDLIVALFADGADHVEMRSQAAPFIAVMDTTRPHRLDFRFSQHNIPPGPYMWRLVISGTEWSAETPLPLKALRYAYTCNRGLYPAKASQIACDNTELPVNGGRQWPRPAAVKKGARLQSCLYPTHRSKVIVRLVGGMQNEFRQGRSQAMRQGACSHAVHNQTADSIPRKFSYRVL